MSGSSRTLLALAPYRLLPPKSGGQFGIVLLEHYLGRLCTNHLVSTSDNGANTDYSFVLHPLFSPGPKRYLPFSYSKELRTLAREKKIDAIICEHPYMAPAAVRLSRQTGKPWFLRSHNIESERFRSLGKRWWPVMAQFEKYAMHQAKGVLFVTPEDAGWAQQHYGLPASRCHHIPFGTTLPASPGGHEEARRDFAAAHQLDPALHWLYFIGAMDYKPNEEAVQAILEEVLPRLRAAGHSFCILIAGKGLSAELQEKIAHTDGLMRYMGFIPDLDQFLKACDLMLNPVLSGGGIKTKAVEALGYGKKVVSTKSGAAGILPEVCGDNLHLCADGDWDAFCAQAIALKDLRADTPAVFYNTYYWGRIAEKVLSIVCP